VKPDNTVEAQQVKVLTSDETDTAEQGLKPGLEVATSGFDRLENGVTVKIRGLRTPQKSTAAHSKASRRRRKKSDQ